MVLLALRDNVRGDYKDMTALRQNADEDGNGAGPLLSHVTVAQPLGKLRDLDVAAWTEREGVVLCRDDGMRFKMKCQWYVAMADAAKLGGPKHFLPKLLQRLPLAQVPPGSIWLMAIADVDDVVAASVAALTSAAASGSRNTIIAAAAEATGGATRAVAAVDEASCLLRFVVAVRQAIMRLGADLSAWASDALDAVGDADAIATYAYQRSAWPVDLTRAAVRRDDSALDRQLRALLKGFCQRGDVATVQHLLGVRWRLCGEGQSFAVEDEILPVDFASFDECRNAALREHVLEIYLPRKLAVLMGVSDIGDAQVRLPCTYRPDEGKIKGMWERFAKVIHTHEGLLCESRRIHNESKGRVASVTNNRLLLITGLDAPGCRVNEWSFHLSGWPHYCMQAMNPMCPHPL